MDGATGFKVMLEKNTRRPGLAGAAVSSAILGSPSTRQRQQSPRPTTCSTWLTKRSIARSTPLHNVEFDMDKRAALSHQIQQRIYDLAIFVPGVQLNYAEPAAGAM